MPEARPQIGLREVLLVVLAVIAVVLAAGVVTNLLPAGGQDVVYRSPLLIAVLIGGTAFVIWRILRTPPTP